MKLLAYENLCHFWPYPMWLVTLCGFEICSSYVISCYTLMCYFSL